VSIHFSNFHIPQLIDIITDQVIATAQNRALDLRETRKAVHKKYLLAFMENVLQMRHCRSLSSYSLASLFNNNSVPFNNGSPIFYDDKSNNLTVALTELILALTESILALTESILAWTESILAWTESILSLTISQFLLPHMGTSIVS